MPAQSPVRKLLAIMFTDIVGYTALMQTDEQKAIRIRNRHREVFNGSHKSYNGQIIQYFGDGTLSTFESALEAVRCAITIQKELHHDEPIPLRIGIHLGDIYYDGTEIYGDGVNVASRVENIALAGSIFISEKVKLELGSHPYLTPKFIGDYQFKNVRNPLKIYAIEGPDLYVPAKNEVQGKVALKEKSIAVLPFVNMSVNKENEFFADGLTEEIINALTRVKNLHVTSRTSSFYFKNRNIPIRDIGSELNVSTILEGSIRMSGSKMRLTAQLIDVENDFHFWSETFDRSLDDIFAVQDEVSLLIADRLREHLGHLEIEDRLVEEQEISPQDYKEYLKARFLLFKMEKKSIQSGEKILLHLTKKYPRYAPAALTMNLAYNLYGTLGFMPAKEAFAQGYQYLLKAIEIDKDHPECHLQLSWISLLQDWDLEQTYKHLNQIGETQPIIDYYQSMASTLIIERKFKATFHYLETAFQIDPFSHINYHLKGFTFYIQENYPKAIDCFLHAIQLKPGFTASILYLGQAYLKNNQIDKAHDHFLKINDKEMGDIIQLGGSILTSAFKKDQQKISTGIATLEKYLNKDLRERALYFLILITAYCKKKDEAFKYLKMAIETKLPMLLYLRIDPIITSIIGDNIFSKHLNQILRNTPNKKSVRRYKKNLLTKKEINHYKKTLIQLMTEKRPYLDPQLTLRDLAALLSLPPNYVSQLLNEGFNQNFSEFVNNYRLNTFIELIDSSDLQHLSILGIALESGFNSKTTFNTFFKKQKGMTPKQFIQHIQQE